MVYTLGESLLDIIFSGRQNIEAHAGGSMLNTSVSLARNGIEVSLISELGDDHTAVLILDFLKQQGVGVKFIKKYFRQTTSVALAHLDEMKVPSFSIYKSYPENRRLIQPPDFTHRDLLFFGSMYSLDPAIRSQLVNIVSTASRQGAIVCFDPNIRTHDLSKPDLRTALFENLAFADVIKASDEDMLSLFGKVGHAAYYREIRKINEDAVFILTLGKDGAVGFYKNHSIGVEARKVKVVSTIGAGDAFNAGIVYHLVERCIGRQQLKSNANSLLKGLLLSGTDFAAEVCASAENYTKSVTG